MLQLGTSKYQDPSFNPYLSRIRELYRIFGYKKYTRNIDRQEIRFADLDNNEVGLCYPYRDIIYIDRSFWARLSHAGREELLLHELGHCVLDYDHTEPFSIMQASGTLEGIYTFTGNYRFFLNEYFRCSKDCPKVEYKEYD